MSFDRLYWGEREKIEEAEFYVYVNQHLQSFVLNINGCTLFNGYNCDLEPKPPDGYDLLQSLSMKVVHKVSSYTMLNPKFRIPTSAFDGWLLEVLQQTVVLI